MIFCVVIAREQSLIAVTLQNSLFCKFSNHQRKKLGDFDDSTVRYTFKQQITQLTDLEMRVTWKVCYFMSVHDAIFWSYYSKVNFLRCCLITTNAPKYY